VAASGGHSARAAILADGRKAWVHISDVGCIDVIVLV
jgi:hypothetical protein